MMAARRSRRSGTENVRMGPIALFTLMAVLCLAVLATLALASAHATASLSQRRADATSQLYFQETVAQVFVAALDAQLAAGREGTEAAEAAQAAAEAEAAQAPDASLVVEVTAEHPSYTARFDCGSGRPLCIALSYGPDRTLRVDQWRMTSVVNEEPPIGTLLGSL